MDVEPISDCFPEIAFIDFLWIEAVHDELAFFLVVEVISDELHEYAEWVSVEDVDIWDNWVGG